MSKYVPTMNDVKHWLCEPPYAGGLFDDETAAKFDVALATHDAEVAAKALIDMALTLEIPRFISSYNQEPPMQRMTNAEIVDALRARAAEYRKAVQS